MSAVAATFHNYPSLYSHHVLSSLHAPPEAVILSISRTGDRPYMGPGSARTPFKSHEDMLACPLTDHVTQGR